jgi:hypothetical protein
VIVGISGVPSVVVWPRVIVIVGISGVPSVVVWPSHVIVGISGVPKSLTLMRVMLLLFPRVLFELQAALGILVLSVSTCGSSPGLS